MTDRSVANPLLDAMVEAFNMEDLRDLCFDLQVDFDDLSGETRHARAREIVLYFQRRRQLSLLVEKVVAVRPGTKAQITAVPVRQLKLPDGPPWQHWPWHVQAGLVTLLLLVAIATGWGAYSYWVNQSDVAPARAGETLVLIAAFRGPPTGALLPEQRIEAAMREAIRDMPQLKITVSVSRRVIADEKTALDWGRAHKASLVIWGWYDASAVQANLVYPNQLASQAVSQTQKFELGGVDAPKQLNQLLPEQAGLAGQVSLGWLAFLNSQDENALKLWDEAIKTMHAAPLDQQRALKLDEVLCLHGIASSHLKNQAQAKADFAEAEKINPENLLAVYNTALLAYSASDFLTVEAKTQKVIDHAPAPQSPLLGLAFQLAAKAKRAQGLLTEATTLAEKSVQAAPNLPTLLTTLSDLYLRQHLWEKAAETAKRATALPEATPADYFNLGRAQLHLNNLDAAKQSYATGLSRSELDDPHDFKVLGLARDELQQDQLDFPNLKDGINSILMVLLANP